MLKQNSDSPLFIPGPVGQLEAILSTTEDSPPNVVGIICHPHPLHDGTMHNKVVTTVARAFRDLSITSIRFNYRGVGKSEGTYAEGIGETEDALAVIKWAEKKWPGSKIWLAGFSFGAFVSLRAATLSTNIAQLISIAPAVNHADFSDLHPHCPWLIIIAEKDTLVPANEIKQWAENLSPAPDVLSFPEANHFFDGELVKLRQQLIEKLNHAHTL